MPNEKKNFKDKDLESLGKAIKSAKKGSKGNGSKVKDYSGKKNNTNDFKPKSVRGKGHNDISFWNQYPILLKQAANIAFNNVAGEPETMERAGEVVVPGTVRIEYLQTIGRAAKWSDPVNLQMKALWLDLHRKFRGVGSYQSSDLAMGLFAICDFFAQIAEAERIYGTYVKYSTLNRNEPRTLLMAEGAPLSVTGIELSDFRASLNLLIAAANTLCLPKGIKLFDILIERCSGIYQDSDSPKSSRYLFATPKYVKYESTLLSTGTALTYVDKQYNTYTDSENTYNYETLVQIITRLRSQLDALLNDSDVQRMCSDLLACYGNDAVFKLDYLEENATIDIVKYDEITMQFHNMRTLDIYNLKNNHVPGVIHSDPNYSSSTLTVYQVDNVVHFDITTHLSDVIPPYEINVGGLSGDYVIASDKSDALSDVILPIHGTLVDSWKTEQPTEDDITEMTRLAIGCEIVPITSSGLPNGSGAYMNVDHGIFIPLCISVYTNPSAYTKNDGTYHLRSNALSKFLDISAPSILTIRTVAVDLRYDWFPFMYIGNWRDWTGMGSVPTVDDLVQNRLEWYPLGDLVNIKFINSHNLIKLHEACVMSAWKVDITTFSLEA